MMKINSVVVPVLVVVVCGLIVVDAWPRVGGQSRGWYECCCPDCPVTCFECRNYIYSCSCDSCSCYAGEGRQVDAPQESNTKSELLQILLRGGFGGSSRIRRDLDQVYDTESADTEGQDWS